MFICLKYIYLLRPICDLQAIKNLWNIFVLYYSNLRVFQGFSLNTNVKIDKCKMTDIKLKMMKFLLLISTILNYLIRIAWKLVK